jgi:ferredoxin
MAAVDAARCIGCGLCAVRCPYGAIYLTDDAVAHVITDDQDGLILEEPAERSHSRPERSGTVGSLASKIPAVVVVRLGHLPDADRNLFVRNLLHEVGMNARVRRRGDTNMRIDAVGFTRSERPFVAEIELVGGELESPRALMEDVAILHARYGFKVADIDALSIITAFPNVRYEYYQVMRDIEEVLGIRCRTLTIGALLALMWSDASIDGFDGSSFAIGNDGIDLANSLDITDPVEPYPGAFKPAK